MFERLIRIGRRATASSVHFECRHCGTTVETTCGGCPACESSEIARYDV